MFIEEVGDHMPTKTEIHLPSCLTKGDVYKLALDDLSREGVQCSKNSTFYEYGHEFPHMTIPKVPVRI